MDHRGNDPIRTRKEKRGKRKKKKEKRGKRKKKKEKRERERSGEQVTFESSAILVSFWAVISWRCLA